MTKREERRQRRTPGCHSSLWCRFSILQGERGPRAARGLLLGSSEGRVERRDRVARLLELTEQPLHLLEIERDVRDERRQHPELLEAAELVAVADGYGVDRPESDAVLDRGLRGRKCAS